MSNRTLLHATPKRNLASIQAEGLRAGAYFTNCESLLAYYADTIRDDGDEPVVLEVSLDDLKANRLGVDWPGIEEPITTVLGMTEEDVEETWGEADGTPLDCLEIIHSIRYRSRVPAKLIRVRPAA